MNTLVNFVKKVTIALLLVIVGKFMIAAHMAVVGWIFILAGHYRLGCFAVEFLGEDFFARFSVNSLSSRFRQFAASVSAKADEMEKQ